MQRRRVDKDEETAMFGEKTGERYANLYPDNWKQQSPAPEPHSRPLWPGPLQPGQRGRVMKAKKEKKKGGGGEFGSVNGILVVSAIDLRAFSMVL